MSDENKTEAVEEGAFVASLKRTNKNIKNDRAEAISEDAQLRYKRYVEDLEIEIKRMGRLQENMLDLSPDNAHSLIVAKNFDSAAYIEQDMELGVKIRNALIKLDIAKKRYAYLFGGE